MLEKVRLAVSHETAFLLENPDYAKIERGELTPEYRGQVVRELDELSKLINKIRTELECTR